MTGPNNGGEASSAAAGESDSEALSGFVGNPSKFMGKAQLKSRTCSWGGSSDRDRLSVRVFIPFHGRKRKEMRRTGEQKKEKKAKDSGKLSTTPKTLPGIPPRYTE